MTEYYRGYVAGINRCRKPALILMDAAEKQMKEIEAKLAKAVEALDEALYFLQPDERDVSKQAGMYRIVKAYEEITGQKYQVDDDKEKNDE